MVHLIGGLSNPDHEARRLLDAQGPRRGVHASEELEVQDQAHAFKHEPN